MLENFGHEELRLSQTTDQDCHKDHSKDGKDGKEGSESGICQCGYQNGRFEVFV